MFNATEGGISMPVRPVVLGASIAALLVPSAAARADTPLLEAFVGANDAFSIRLQDASGTRVLLSIWTSPVKSVARR